MYWSQVLIKHSNAWKCFQAIPALILVSLWPMFDANVFLEVIHEFDILRESCMTFRALNGIKLKFSFGFHITFDWDSVCTYICFKLDSDARIVVGASFIDAIVERFQVNSRLFSDWRRFFTFWWKLHFVLGLFLNNDFLLLCLNGRWSWKLFNNFGSSFNYLN